MKISPTRFAFSALACLAMMATSADAATILTFGQTNPVNTVTSTSVGGTTTFATAGTTVTVANIGGVTPPPGTTLPETFNFTSSGPIVANAGGGFTQTGFSGTFSFGTQVVGTLSGGILSTFTGPTGLVTGSFNSSNVTFTTLGAGILAQLGIANVSPLVIGSLSLTLNNVTSTSLNFTGQNAGIVNAEVIPEPASVVMMSMAVVAGLGGVGLRRFKAARA